MSRRHTIESGQLSQQISNLVFAKEHTLFRIEDSETHNLDTYNRQ